MDCYCLVLWLREGICYGVVVNGMWFFMVDLWGIDCGCFSIVVNELWLLWCCGE